ncbi:uncharacterized protein LOC135153869 [Lytechinus pictus]|uniref:uncharacterized protein LOC135153869 n=1 Tax=Lytechinus pictus TaxID=7653 RepID=UPI0030BA0946
MARENIINHESRFTPEDGESTCPPETQIAESLDVVIMSITGEILFSYKLKWEFLLLLGLLTFKLCNPRHVKADEGGTVQLRFSYPCNAKDLSLQYSNRLPFYRLEDSIEFLNLRPDQNYRYSLENDTAKKTFPNRCSLLLIIEPVSRDDEGTFILFADKFTYMTRVGLRVPSLPGPGPAHCDLDGYHFAGRWLKLQCTARAGSDKGQIQCYQDSIMMPPLNRPFETWENLQQTILVRQIEQEVFCCSSPLGRPKDKCDCRDFVWSPSSKNESRIIGPLCSSTTMTAHKELVSTEETVDVTSMTTVSAGHKLHGVTNNIHTGRKRSKSFLVTYFLVMGAFCLLLILLRLAIYLKQSDISLSLSHV